MNNIIYDMFFLQGIHIYHIHKEMFTVLLKTTKSEERKL